MEGDLKCKTPMSVCVSVWGGGIHTQRKQQCSLNDKLFVEKKLEQQGYVWVSVI